MNHLEEAKKTINTAPLAQAHALIAIGETLEKLFAALASQPKVQTK